LTIFTNPFISSKKRTNEKSTNLDLVVGAHVIKTGGDYTFDGIVVARFAKLSGKIRYVVENKEGILHIFGATNLVEVR
jgi:hypothetical protein